MPLFYFIPFIVIRRQVLADVRMIKGGKLRCSGSSHMLFLSISKAWLASAATWNNPTVFRLARETHWTRHLFPLHFEDICFDRLVFSKKLLIWRLPFPSAGNLNLRIRFTSCHQSMNFLLLCFSKPFQNWAKELIHLFNKICFNTSLWISGSKP